MDIIDDDTQYNLDQIMQNLYNQNINNVKITICLVKNENKQKLNYILDYDHYHDNCKAKLDKIYVTK